MQMTYLKKLAKNFAASAKGLKSPRTLTACAMLLALGVVLDYFCSFYATPTLKVSFTFLPIGITGSLFGPVPAMLSGGLLDVVMWLVKPAGAYFPGYTLSGILGGLIYGVCLYGIAGKQVYYMPAVAKGLINVLVNILLNTCWSMIFTGKAYLVLLSTRVVKNLVLLPAEALLLMALILFLKKHPLYKK